MIALLGVSLLTFEIEADGQLPQAHPYIHALNQIHDEFGDKNLVVIGLFPTDGNIFDQSFLRRLFLITQDLATIPGINHAMLQSLASSSVRTISRDETGLRVDPLLSSAPESKVQIEALRGRIATEPLLADTLVSSSEPAVAIYATFELTPELPGYSHLHDAVEAILIRHEDTSVSYRLSGPVIVASALNRSASRMLYFIPLALAVLALVHYDAFRTWQAVLLPLATGLGAVIWSIGLLGFLQVPIDPFNALTPLLVISIAAGHGIQILQRFNEEFERSGDSTAATIQTLNTFGPVMAIAGAIASVAFLSLTAIGTRSMTTFGLFTAAGVTSVVLLELTFIPALRSIFGGAAPARPPRAFLSIPLNAILSASKWSISSGTRARRVLLCCGAIAIVCAYFASTISVDTSLIRAFDDESKTRLDDEVLNRAFAGTNVLLLRLEGATEGAIMEPATLRGIRKLSEDLLSIPQVGKVLAITDTLAKMQQVLSPEGPELPASAELATQYLFLYSLAGGNDLSTKITPDNQITKLVALIKGDSTRSGQLIINQALALARRDLPPSISVSVAGTVASNAALTDVVVRGKVQSVIQILGLAGLCAAVFLRSFIAGVLVVTPLAAAALVVFGVIGAFGIPLDIPMAVASALALGMGADFGIYLLFRVREEVCATADVYSGLNSAVNSAGRAIIAIASAVGLGCGVLCLSSFRLFVQLGALAAMTMAVAASVTLVILPCLVRLIAELNLSAGVLDLKTTKGFNVSQPAGSSRIQAAR